jgi:hypothetical protein
MIFESYPWKMELKNHLKRFKTWEKKLHTERGGFYIERGIFLSAFIIRKLMENRKVTDVVRNKIIKVEAFRAKRPMSDRVTRFFGVSDPNDEYDFKKPEKIFHSAYELMNQIIHSYAFMFVGSRKNVCRAFLVNSYRARDRYLLQINRKDFEKILTEVIHDEVWMVHVKAHPDTDKIIATVEGKKLSTVHRKRSSR